MKADEARSQATREELHGWFDNTLLTRLDAKGAGVILSIQQRLHEDDLPAYLLEKGYQHLNLPAIAEKEEQVAIGAGRFHKRMVGDLLDPQRESLAVLDQLRRDLGSPVFSAQYQQDPIAPEGNLIRMEWFGTYSTAPQRHRFLKVVQSWDTGMSAAPTSDYSVCTTWGFELATKNWYLLEVFRHRLDFPDLKRAVIELQRRWTADLVLIEKAGSGFCLCQELAATGPFRPVMIRPSASKEERFAGCLAEVEAGQFLLPAEAPWLTDFRNELKAFPAGRYDDQVDSFSQFVRFQLIHWKRILKERTASGRVKRALRLRTRPW
ncbi:phage terminase large subunit [Novosphingobium sp. Gsoil 351]|uniref:phage terminase large subunit n=1 Tax=Novosphingobium sp. Gsoil 351 TaxID=2675225 RepID=UPI0018A8411C|nr:phage terminase large subunit [Novosphingobium sp. Gsoil 351]